MRALPLPATESSEAGCLVSPPKVDYKLRVCELENHKSCAMEVSKSLQVDIKNIQNQLKTAIRNHQASKNFSRFLVTLSAHLLKS
jgi:hypothetical protein